MHADFLAQVATEQHRANEDIARDAGSVSSNIKLAGQSSDAEMQRIRNKLNVIAASFTDALTVLSTSIKENRQVRLQEIDTEAGMVREGVQADVDIALARINRYAQSLQLNPDTHRVWRPDEDTRAFQLRMDRTLADARTEYKGILVDFKTSRTTKTRGFAALCTNNEKAAGIAERTFISSVQQVETNAEKSVKETKDAVAAQEKRTEKDKRDADLAAAKKTEAEQKRQDRKERDEPKQELSEQRFDHTKEEAAKREQERIAKNTRDADRQRLEDEHKERESEQKRRDAFAKEERARLERERNEARDIVREKERAEAVRQAKEAGQQLKRDELAYKKALDELKRQDALEKEERARQDKRDKDLRDRQDREDKEREKRRGHAPPGYKPRPRPLLARLVLQGLVETDESTSES